MGPRATDGRDVFARSSIPRGPMCLPAARTLRWDAVVLGSPSSSLLRSGFEAGLDVHFTISSCIAVAALSARRCAALGKTMGLECLRPPKLQLARALL